MERKREMEREERWKRDKWRAREREALRQIDRPTEGHRERETFRETCERDRGA